MILFLMLEIQLVFANDCQTRLETESHSGLDTSEYQGEEGLFTCNYFHVIDHKQESSVLTSVEKEKRESCKSQWMNICHTKAIYWRQRSKVKWLLEGDCEKN